MFIKKNPKKLCDLIEISEKLKKCTKFYDLQYFKYKDHAGRFRDYMLSRGNIVDINI